MTATCQAHDIFTYKNALSLIAKAAIIHGPDDAVVTRGCNATFMCDVYGQPAPNIHWLINGQPVNISTEITPRYSFWYTRTRTCTSRLCRRCRFGQLVVVLIFDMCCSLQLVDPATGFLFGNSTLILNVKTYTEVSCVAENVVHTGASSDTKTATVNVTGTCARFGA